MGVLPSIDIRKWSQLCLTLVGPELDVLVSLVVSKSPRGTFKHIVARFIGSLPFHRLEAQRCGHLGH